MSDDFDNVVKWQKTVTFDLRVDVLALRDVSQQLHKACVVQQQAIGVATILLGPHHLNKLLERTGVVEEHQHLVTDCQQLDTDTNMQTRTQRHTHIMSTNRWNRPN